MRQVGTVIVDTVFLRSKPSDAEDTIVGDLKRGQVVDVVETVDDAKNHPMAVWLKIKHGKGFAYVAERNRATGQRFVNVQSMPSNTDEDTGFSKWVWWGITIVVVAIAAVAMYWMPA